jgi:hypothetical protein
MGFRKQSPRLSLSRRPLSRQPYLRDALEAPLTEDPAGDEPLCGVKLGRVSVLADGVAFTPLHAGRAAGRTVAYAPQALMTCLCGLAEPPAIMGARRSPRWHEHPVAGDGHCGFYAWKPGQPLQWVAGTWMLDVDLYGRVVEHERGYRAQKQRVLRISPVPGAFCEPPFSLSYGADDGHITTACPACPPSPPAAGAHPVTADSLRRLLNVEVDMERAWRLRADATRGS